MKKIFKSLRITQERKRIPELGITPRTQYRLNPYNPLSYLVILGWIVTAFVINVFIGVREAISENPFKWS